jgi:Na+/pantothenate symporter
MMVSILCIVEQAKKVKISIFAFRGMGNVMFCMCVCLCVYLNVTGFQGASASMVICAGDVNTVPD